MGIYSFPPFLLYLLLIFFSRKELFLFLLLFICSTVHSCIFILFFVLLLFKLLQFCTLGVLTGWPHSFCLALSSFLAPPPDRCSRVFRYLPSPALELTTSLRSILVYHHISFLANLCYTAKNSIYFLLSLHILFIFLHRNYPVVCCVVVGQWFIGFMSPLNDSSWVSHKPFCFKTFVFSLYCCPNFEYKKNLKRLWEMNFCRVLS